MVGPTPPFSTPFHSIQPLNKVGIHLLCTYAINTACPAFIAGKGNNGGNRADVVELSRMVLVSHLRHILTECSSSNKHTIP